MTVLMIGIVMAVRMRVARPVGMHMFVVVKDDFQTTPKGVGDAAKGGEARDMIAAFET